MAFGQTVLTYGTKSAERLMLFRCATPQIRQSPVLDFSGTDLKCWRHEITVCGYVQGAAALRAFEYHRVFSATPADITVADSAALAQRQARWRLPPRGRFILRTGVTDTADVDSGTVLYDVDAAVTVFPGFDPGDVADRTDRLKGVDVNDGPVCHDCTVEHVTADNIFKVRVTFVVHLVECTDTGATPSRTTPVLSNRWSCTDHLDVNLRATRIYEGLLELISAQFSPHHFRSLVLPFLQPGFRRDSMTFSASADGKKLQWRVVDQAIAVAAPYPARTWHIEHTEAGVFQDGLKSMGTVHVTLEGDSDVDKSQLIILGLHVISAKLLLAPFGFAPAPTTMLGDVSITDFTGDVNAVRLSASVQRVSPQAASGIGIDPGVIGKNMEIPDFPEFVNATDQYDAKRSMGARDSDTTVYEGPESLTGIFRCFLQSPCTDTHAVNIRTNRLGSDYNPTPEELEQASYSGVVASDIPTDPAPYSDDHTTMMYRFYQCESHYKKKTLRAAMPIAISDEGPDDAPVETTKFVKLGGSQCRRIIRIHAERVGEWPQFPDPENFDGLTANVSADTPDYPYSPSTIPITMGLLSSRIVPGTKTLTATGEILYRATLQMTFALSRCPRAADVLKVGVDVWSNDLVTVTGSVLTGDITATQAE